MGITNMRSSVLQGKNPKCIVSHWIHLCPSLRRINFHHVAPLSRACDDGTFANRFPRSPFSQLHFFLRFSANSQTPPLGPQSFIATHTQFTHFFLQLCNVQQGNIVVSILVIFIVVADGAPLLSSFRKKKTFSLRLLAAAAAGDDDWSCCCCCCEVSKSEKVPHKSKQQLLPAIVFTKYFAEKSRPQRTLPIGGSAVTLATRKRVPFPSRVGLNAFNLRK